VDNGWNFEKNGVRKRIFMKDISNEPTSKLAILGDTRANTLRYWWTNVGCEGTLVVSFCMPREPFAKEGTTTKNISNPFHSKEGWPYA